MQKDIKTLSRHTAPKDCGRVACESVHVTRDYMEATDSYEYLRLTPPSADLEKGYTVTSLVTDYPDTQTVLDNVKKENEKESTTICLDATRLKALLMSLVALEKEHGDNCFHKIDLTISDARSPLVIEKRFVDGATATALLMPIRV